MKVLNCDSPLAPSLLLLTDLSSLRAPLTATSLNRVLWIPRPAPLFITSSWPPPPPGPQIRPLSLSPDTLRISQLSSQVTSDTLRPISGAHDHATRLRLFSRTQGLKWIKIQDHFWTSGFLSSMSQWPYKVENTRIIPISWQKWSGCIKSNCSIFIQGHTLVNQWWIFPENHWENDISVV